MKNAFECRRFAEECRALANGLCPESRQEVLRMADIWEDLARDREAMAKRKRKAPSSSWQEHRTA